VHRFETVRDKKGRTAMHLAAARGRLAVLEFLWSKAADMDAEDDDGRTPLHLAAANGHVDCVCFLVDKGGAFADGADSAHGLTALEMAACRGHDSVVRALVERGARLPDGLAEADVLRIGAEVARGGDGLDEGGADSAEVAGGDDGLDEGVRSDQEVGHRWRLAVTVAFVLILISMYMAGDW
jgi:hypothetical protein